MERKISIYRQSNTSILIRILYPKTSREANISPFDQHSFSKAGFLFLSFPNFIIFAQSVLNKTANLLQSHVRSTHSIGFANLINCLHNTDPIHLKLSYQLIAVQVSFQYKSIQITLSDQYHCAIQSRCIHFGTQTSVRYHFHIHEEAQPSKQSLGDQLSTSTSLLFSHLLPIVLWTISTPTLLKIFANQIKYRLIRGRSLHSKTSRPVASPSVNHRRESIYASV